MREYHYRTRRPREYHYGTRWPAGEVIIFTRPAGAVMIFTRSRNAATGDNSMYCMIPDPPSSAFGKGSATPDYGVVSLKVLYHTLGYCSVFY